MFIGSYFKYYFMLFTFTNYAYGSQIILNIRYTLDWLKKLFSLSENNNCCYKKTFFICYSHVLNLKITKFR